MDGITVHRPTSSVVDGRPELSADIEVDERHRNVYFRASRGPLTEKSDPFLAVALLPAMRLNLPVRVEGTVSALLMDHVARIQDIFCAWYPAEMHRVEVQAERVVGNPLRPEARVGSFFSGGIDSFYNLLKHQAEIDDPIFIHGFDVPLQDLPLRDLTAGRLRLAAAEMHKTLLEVETNLRIMLDPYTDWNLHSHGAALGCVALALAPQFRRIYIGATHSYVEFRAHGSNPVLDPLWGHESLEIVHDGCEWSRWRKAEQIINKETVLRYLRVCFTYPRHDYNCGNCYGCRMVMIFLRATGMADKCATFPPLDLSLIADEAIPTSARRSFYDTLLDIAQERQLDAPLIAALQARLAQAEAEGILPFREIPELRQTQAELYGVQVDLRRVRAELKDLKASRSWRLTAPLRSASALARRLRR